MKKPLLRSLFLACFVFVIVHSTTYAQDWYELSTTDSLITVCVDEVNSDSVESYLQFLQDKGTRFLIAPNRRAVAESIKEKFLQLGADHVRIDSFLCYTKINMWNLHFDTTTWQYNIAATIDGITDGNQRIVMGAHYDDVVAPDGDPMVFAPGADDNASGVAALFESVRVLSLHQFEPVYDIEFVAFSAEELMYFGNSGAQAYVDTALAKGVNMELMINNDMIAYTASDNWELTISNYVGSQWITYIAEEITEEYTSIDPYVRELSNQGGADCKYFYEAGVPCVYFMEKDFNPYYHTENDLVENCDIEYTAEAIKVSVGSVIKASDYIITDVNEISDIDFLAYPNPTAGEVIIRLDKTNAENPLTYRIIDLQGRQLISGELFNGQQKRINLNHLPDGMYILSVGLESSTPTNKIIIKQS